MQWVGVGFHTDASVADAEIGDHQRTCRSWSKTSFYCSAPAKPDSRRWGWNVLSQHVREPKRVEDNTLHHLIRRFTEPIECSIAWSG
jgi:hypothetical protein